MGASPEAIYFDYFFSQVHGCRVAWGHAEELKNDVEATRHMLVETPGEERIPLSALT